MNLKFPALIYFCVVLMAGFFLIHYPDELVSIAVPIIENNSKQQVIRELKQNNVIYLAENHDQPEEHQAQLAIITQLHDVQLNPKRDLAIALEMFQRPFQPVLDRYLAGEITEVELKEQTEYDNRWGYDWEYYAPVLRLAQKHQIPLIALNTPSEVTLKVANTGLDSLVKDDFRYIPALADIKLDNPEYRANLVAVYQEHSQNGHGNSDGFENFLAAQVLWDETMAEAIANYYQNNPQSQIIVLVGQGHVINNHGIPDRVTRRITAPSFSQTSVLLEKQEK